MFVRLTLKFYYFRAAKWTSMWVLPSFRQSEGWFNEWVVCQHTSICFELLENKQWQLLISCGRNKLKLILFNGILWLNSIVDPIITFITVRLRGVGDKPGRVSDVTSFQLASSHTFEQLWSKINLEFWFIDWNLKEGFLVFCPTLIFCD